VAGTLTVLASGRHVFKAACTAEAMI